MTSHFPWWNFCSQDGSFFFLGHSVLNPGNGCDVVQVPIDQRCHQPVWHQQPLSEILWLPLAEFYNHLQQNNPPPAFQRHKENLTWLSWPEWPWKETAVTPSIDTCIMKKDQNNLCHDDNFYYFEEILRENLQCIWPKNELQYPQTDLIVSRLQQVRSAGQKQPMVKRHPSSRKREGMRWRHLDR